MVDEFNNPTSANRLISAALNTLSKRRPLGIRAKVLSLVTFSAIGPVLVVGTASYFTARTIVVDKVTSELSSAADSSEEQVIRWLEERESDTKVFASSFVVSENLTRYESARRKRDPRTAEASARSIQGYLEHIRERYPLCEALLLIDREGTRVGEAGLLTTHKDVILEHQSSDRGNVIRLGSDIVFLTTSSIKARDDRSMGSLVSASKMTGLWDRLSPVIRKKRGWSLRVIDRSGTPVFDSRDEPPVLARDITTEGVRRCLGGEDGLSEYDDGNGNRVLGANRAVTNSGLGLLLEMDSEPAFSTVGELRSFNIFVSASATVIVVLLGYVLTLSMLRPIRALTLGAVAASRGDLSFEIPVTSADDIGYLTTVFNKMTAALQSLHATLEQMSLTDELTRLHNRRFLTKAFEAEVNHVKRTALPLSVLVIDVDYFKAFNDRFGHPRGDIFLRELGSFLLHRARSTDVAVRYGGEEFVLLLPGIDRNHAIQKAELLREEIAATRFAGEEFFALTVSIGVAACPEDGSTPEELLQKADGALYDSKNKGRNRVVFAKRDEGADDVSTDRDDNDPCGAHHDEIARRKP